MPVYSIMNKDTEEVTEVNMKFAEFEQYLKDNQHIKQVFVRFPATGDSVRLGMRRPDDGFKDVLKTVASHHKQNIINTF